MMLLSSTHSTPQGGNPVLSVSPGGLVKLGESLTITPSRAGVLTVSLRSRGRFEEVARVSLLPGEAWTWRPQRCGSYLAGFESEGERFQRPLGVVDEEWAVCQITVGAFTAEDFAETIHPAGVAADYYVTLPRDGKDLAFSAADERWLKYEREFGDAIHPHVMAADIGEISPEAKHGDSNWDSLDVAGIRARLSILQRWWSGRGFEPLDRIATYTPCNELVEACAETGIRVIHSLCPEQNWSDGEWAINHWGMPTCPFWIARDDFRKAGRREERGVLGITMNHYQVVLPHLTHWGDFVLSPSHFARWNRSADAGEEPVRFRQFLEDTVRGWRPLSGDPFFFVAGFEFGRTFGTRRMTRYNRRGLESLIALAESQRLVFATSRDVLGYYERHVPQIPERAFRQRDAWAGVTVNGKPALAGDSIVLERNGYKAAIRDGEALPWFYYDYRRPWHYEPRDTEIPENFAAACGAELSLDRSQSGRIVIEAAKPLSRAVPVALWDARAVQCPFPVCEFPALDDGRAAACLEVPAGWCGRVEVGLETVAAVHSPVDAGNGWKMQAFGEGERRHVYVALELPLTGRAPLPVTLARSVRAESATGPLGELSAGTHEIEFSPWCQWVRFWNCEPADIKLPPLEGVGQVLRPGWEKTVEEHEARLAAVALQKLGAGSGQLRLQTLCGGNLPQGTRSRAAAWDRGFAEGVSAHEFSDGVIAYGPGCSFWYHPRRLKIKVRLSEELRRGGKRRVLLNSFDPVGLGARYRVVAAGRDLGVWTLPHSPWEEAAWFSFEFEPAEANARGEIQIFVKTDQVQVLDEWWKDCGFIAAVHAIWIL